MHLKQCYCKNIIKDKMANQTSLSEVSVHQNPFIQFDTWYKEHLASGADIPDAVSLGTSTTGGKVSVRTVLLKDYSEYGFVFYTNYNSKKGSQLSENNNVALLFYWTEAGRQVRIEGITEKVSGEVSDLYFSTRPRESQISTWASNQSNVVPGRPHLEERHAYYTKLFAGRNVNRPPYWGGFRIVPAWFEFWQNDDKRLHDRITYTKVNNKWIIERLAP
jgi:pyridoxamine 5'-phosphate oxidase